jgi:DNA-binding SARP family transcriptional activator
VAFDHSVFALVMLAVIFHGGRDRIVTGGGKNRVIAWHRTRSDGSPVNVRNSGPTHGEYGQMKARAKLHLRVLGGFEARLDPGPVVVLPTKKTQALLTYLALPLDRSHPRDKLASLLWGDMPDTQALGNLRQALTRIRRVLPRPLLRALVYDGKTVALDSSLVEVDAGRFEQLVADGKPESFEQAAVLYRGDLLAGLTLAERSFEDWLMPERERLHELALQALARLLAHQQELRLAEAAIQTGLRLLALDPLQEAVHRAVMRLYTELGRREAALRQYQRCVSILRRELAAEPELETQRLYQEILRQRPFRSEAPLRARSSDSIPAAHARSTPIQVAGETPLVGREDELKRLHTALEAALAGQGQLVAVLGEAGIGKTRLLVELASLAAQQGMAILVGHAYESEQILPYGPCIDAFRSSDLLNDMAIVDTLNPGVRAEIMRLVPALGDRSADVSMASEPSQVFSAVAQMIGELVTRQPLLLILEDLQWADEMTLRLMAFLTRSLPPRPVLLAISARVEGLADALILNRTLDELSLDKRLLRLNLDALTEPATLELASRVASGGRTRQALATLGPEVWRVSEGNPFVVVETMQALERGAVPEAASLSVPARVRVLVAGRLERLPESERRLISVAAVIGRQFSFRLLRQRSGLTMRSSPPHSRSSSGIVCCTWWANRSTSCTIESARSHTIFCCRRTGWSCIDASPRRSRSSTSMIRHHST